MATLYVGSTGRASSASPTVRTPTIVDSPRRRRRPGARRCLRGITQRREPELRGFAHAQARPASSPAPRRPGRPRRTRRRRQAIGRLRRLDATAATHGEIGRRLVDRHAARDVHEHIVGRQVQAGALVEHGEQQRQPVRDRGRWPCGAHCRTSPRSRAPAPRRGSAASLRSCTAPTSPGTFAGRSARNSCDGFGTGSQARAGHLEHAQLARPRRTGSSRRARRDARDAAAPSKYSTVSTTCSSTFGPARLPSFVTWPTRIVGRFRPFAVNSRSVAACRTWPTLPGADGIFSENTV